MVVLIKCVDYPDRTGQGRLGITWKRYMGLGVPKLNMNQHWDKGCIAPRRAGIVLLYLSWYYGHQEPHEHLVPHFKEPYQGAPREVEPEL